MRDLRFLAAGAAAVGLGTIGGLAYTSGFHGQGQSSSRVDAAIVAASRAGVATYFSSVVDAPTPTQRATSGIGVTRDFAAARTADADSDVARDMTGQAAVQQRLAVSNNATMAVMHAASRPGAPIAVVNVGGGVIDFAVQRVFVHGNTATVEATCVSWMTTEVWYPGRAHPTLSSPKARERDTLSLQRGSDGIWRLAHYGVDLTAD